jgi:hypothetical protein
LGERCAAGLEHPPRGFIGGNLDLGRLAGRDGLADLEARRRARK